MILNIFFIPLVLIFQVGSRGDLFHLGAIIKQPGTHPKRRYHKRRVQVSSQETERCDHNADTSHDHPKKFHEAFSYQATAVGQAFLPVPDRLESLSYPQFAYLTLTGIASSSVPGG